MSEPQVVLDKAKQIGVVRVLEIEHTLLTLRPVALHSQQGKERRARTSNAFDSKLGESVSTCSRLSTKSRPPTRTRYSSGSSRARFDGGSSATGEPARLVDIARVQTASDSW